MQSDGESQRFVLCYNKQLGMYGYGFDGQRSAMAFLHSNRCGKSTAGHSHLINKFLAEAKLYCDKNTCIFAPLVFESSRDLMRVVDPEYLVPVNGCNRSISKPLDYAGVPAIVNDEVGILYSSHLQFSFQVNPLLDELGYKEDIAFVDTAPDELLFFPYKGVLHLDDLAMPLRKVLISDPTLLILELQNDNKAIDWNIKYVPIASKASDPFATAHKSKAADDSLGLSGCTTIASASTLALDSPMNDRNITFNNSSAIASRSHRRDMLMLATEFAREEKLSHMWIQLETNVGWSTGKATWTTKWWKDETIYISPWNKGSSYDKSWRCGCDYFFSLQDVSSYILIFEDELVRDVTKCMLRKILVDFEDGSWDLDKRIEQTVSNDEKNIDTDRLQDLLKKSGWIVVTLDGRIGRRASPTLFIPPWHSSTVNSDNFKNYDANYHYFLDIDRVINYIKTHSNVPTSQYKSPKKSKVIDICESADSPNDNLSTIRLEIMQLIRSKVDFVELWPRLQQLNWRHVNTEGSYEKSSSVYIPSWTEYNKNANKSFAARRYQEKRDFFVKPQDVINYISKYGLNPSEKAVTPEQFLPRSRKSVKTFDPTNRTEFERKSREMNRSNASKRKRSHSPDDKSSKNEAKGRKITMTEVDDDSVVSSILTLSSDDEREPQSLDEIVSSILARDPKKCYIFPDLWDVLTGNGWRTVYDTHDQQVFVPEWSNISANTPKGKRIDVSPYLRGIDYFDNKNELMNHLRKYGCNCKSNKSSPLSHSKAKSSRKHSKESNDRRPAAFESVAATLNEPAVEAAKTKKKKASAKKFDPIKPIEKNEVELPDELKDMTPLQRKIFDIIQRDESKAYRFPELWPILRETCGWRNVMTNDPLCAAAYLPYWTVSRSSILPNKRFDISHLVRDEDYFCDKNDIIRFLHRPEGLKRLHPIPAMEDSIFDSDDHSVKSSRKRNMSHVIAEPTPYTIPIILPRKAVQGRENKDFNEYEQFHSVLEVSDEHGSPIVQSTPTPSSSIKSTASIDRSSWTNMNVDEVLTIIERFRYKDSHDQVLLGREKVFGNILQFIYDSFDNRHGKNLLIHGQPGQGKTHMIRCICNHLKCMNEHDNDFSIPEFDVVNIQGTTTSSSSDIFIEIASKLNMNVSNIASKAAVMNRFRSAPKSWNETSSDISGSRSSKKSKQDNHPMMMLIVDEAFQGNHDDLREILEVNASADDHSSVIVICLFNNRLFYESLRSKDLCHRIDVPVYSSETLSSIARYYTCDIIEEQGLKLIGMNCFRNDSSDVRALKETCSEILSNYHESLSPTDGMARYTGHPLINLAFVRSSISSMNNSQSVTRSRVLNSLNSQSLRILVSMMVEAVGVSDYASVQDIRQSYELYGSKISYGEIQHFGDFDNCLQELAEQTFLAKSTAGKLKKYKLSVTREDLMEACSDDHPVYLRSLTNSNFKVQTEVDFDQFTFNY